ncbi:MAG TPA: glycosyltransferase [Pirellulales bacterium]|nr:glycosyltransferase [Pirellulales bacterium]
MSGFDSRFFQELEYGLIFKRDLERLLALAKAGCDDHVLLGTAHAREAPAVHLITKRLGDARSPQFHLEFRHPLFRSEPTPQEFDESQNVLMHRQFFSLYEKWGSSSRMHFYTDTEELSRDHELLGKPRFGVLPIPFRTEFVADRLPSADNRLRLAYLGEPRDEKGFPWLPDLIDRMMQKYVATGRVRFILQANICAPQYNPKCAAIMPRLRQYSREFVQLVGHDSPLSPEDYYRLLSQADIVLLPYDRDRYRACSSGTLAEAIASGCPVVVPADSWMSSQIGPGTGETFDDRESFFAAVERVVENFDSYRSAAEAHREHWLAKHTPDLLVEAIIGPHGRSAQARIAA